jgi:hypothetical protein
MKPLFILSATALTALLFSACEDEREHHHHHDREAVTSTTTTQETSVQPVAPATTTIRTY